MPLNTSHALYSNILYAARGYFTVEEATGTAASVTGSPTQTTINGGTEDALIASSGNYKRFAVTPRTAFPFSVFVRFHFVWTTNGTLVSFGHEGDAIGGWSLRVYDLYAATLFSNKNNYGNDLFVVDPHGLSNGATVSLCVTIDSSRNMTMYANGSSVGTDTFGAPGDVIGTTTTQLAIGHRTNNSGTPEDWYSQGIGMVTILDKALSGSEVSSLHSAPYDIFSGAPSGPATSGDTQRLTRGAYRGIARGVFRRAADWIRTPSGLLVPA